MAEEGEERQPLVFRVNANPRWTSHSRRIRNDANTGYGSSSDRNNESLSSRLTSDPSINSPSPTSTIPKRVWLSSVCVLLSLMFERIALYGLTGNFVLFVNKAPFYWMSIHAQGIVFLFFGVAFVLSPLGGWIADSFLGRFRTLAVFFVVYFAGYVMLIFIADDDGWNNSDEEAEHSMTKLPEICNHHGNYSSSVDTDDPFEENCAWLIYLVMIVLAICDGVLKTNYSSFGFDQVATMNTNVQMSFFHWYYWMTNIGAFIGMGLMTYLEQQVSFKTGYTTCAICLAIAIVIFAIGRCFYTCRPPDGSVITKAYRIFHEAWKRKRQRTLVTKMSSEQNDTMSSTTDEVEVAPSSSMDNISFLDYAKHQHGGIYHNSVVEDLKKLKMVFAVFASLVPYWLVYYQMQTTFLFQAFHMRLDLSPYEGNVSNIHAVSLLSESGIPIVPTNNGTGVPHPQIVAAWFSLFNVVAIIILLPLVDRVIYPRLARAGHPVTFAKRVVIGMLFSISAAVIAGLVEKYRLKAFWPWEDQPCRNASIPQYIGNTRYEAADMSVFWQIPQFACIGISEVFASVACLQFAVSMAPKSMKALITGVYYLSCGLGSIIGTALPYILFASRTWIFSEDHGNINCRIPCSSEKDTSYKHACHMDYYFYLLAGLECVGLLVFLYVSKTFGLNKDHMLTYNHRPPSSSRVVQRRVILD